MKLFRKNHIINILEKYSQSEAPLDLFLHHYFKSNRSIGSHDRKEIAETVYAYTRNQALIRHQSSPNIRDQVEWLCANDLEAAQHRSGIPDHVRVSFPKEYFMLLEQSLGLSSAIEFCKSSNAKAPVTIRANTHKIQRDALLLRLSDRFHCTANPYSSWGIDVHGQAVLFQTPEFAEGLFEMQDAASQLAAQLVEAKPHDAVLDFCCGAGGKTLAFAPQMEGKGQIYIHDVREHALQEAKKRLKRAGIQNYQILDRESAYFHQKKRQMDWVLVDAPCSGSGTLRRNPDQKWRFKRSSIDELVVLQRTIFAQALQFLKPNGKIVYATCSVLKEENKEQVDFFCENHHLQLVKPFFEVITSSSGMDGFFAAVMEIKKP